MDGCMNTRTVKERRFGFEKTILRIMGDLTAKAIKDRTSTQDARALIRRETRIYLNTITGRKAEATDASSSSRSPAAGA
jgi:hypothetical protein